MPVYKDEGRYMRDILLTVTFSLIGYLAGSILFAKIFVSMMGHVDVESRSDDGNPGTANAYKNGGFWCGTLVLICDIGKGLLPVALFLHMVKVPGVMIIPVMIAPVLGHAFSIYDHFRGGKCIAVSFGVLLGLFPDLVPALILALFYILFSVIRIRPHSKRTFVSFMCASIAALFFVQEKTVVVAIWIISAIVQKKHILEDRRMQERAVDTENIKQI